MVAPAAARAHPRDLLVWHGLSWVCMGLMLVAALPVWATGAAVAVFVLGLTWCAVQVARQPRRTAYLRLAVCCLAMLVMLRPGGAGHQATSGMQHMPGAGPTLLAAVLAVALLCVAVAGTAPVVRAAATSRSQALSLAEAALAVLMAGMLVGLV